MKNIFKLIALGLLVLAAASCSKSRAEQMKMAENIKVTCNPEVLALTGDKIPADITVTYPAGYFYPKATLTVTPVLVYEGGEQAAPSFTYQGEKVKDNYTVVPSAGGTVKEKVAFDYVKGVEKSYLELRSVAYYKGHAIQIPAIKVADGVNTTQMWVSTSGVYSFKKDNYQEVLHEQAEGQIMYDVNSATVKKNELRSESIKELQSALAEIASDPRYTVTGTSIVSYASPEGGQELNAKLSDKRADSAQKAWDKVTNGMKADNLEVKSVGQDWDGFREAVENSNIEDKDLILRVLSMYSDPAVRESEIKNMSQVYTEINKSVFPELRRSRFITSVDYQNFSDAELAELADKAVDVLDEDALLRVAANSTDNSRKAELYKLAASKYSSDKANFNLAVMALNEGKNDEAANYLSNVKDADADVLNAKGVVEMRKGNTDKAVTYFTQSGSYEAQENLGIIDVQKGDYASAAKHMEGHTGHNAAVTYILNNQLDKASAAITCNCAKSSYIKAIIAARKGNSSDVKKYLDTVGKASAAFKAKAEKDVEFANYR